MEKKLWSAHCGDVQFFATDEQLVEIAISYIEPEITCLEYEGDPLNEIEETKLIGQRLRQKEISASEKVAAMERQGFLDRIAIWREPKVEADLLVDWKEIL